MLYEANSTLRSPVLETWAIQPRLSAIVIGSLICLALQGVLLLLANGLGLTANIPVGFSYLDSRAWMTITYFGLSIAFSFFVGGYVSARLANQPFRVATVLHGVGTWAMVSLALLFYFRSAQLAIPVFLNIALTGCISLGVGAFASLLGSLMARRPFVAATTGYTSKRPLPKVA